MLGSKACGKGSDPFHVMVTYSYAFGQPEDSIDAELVLELPVSRSVSLVILQWKVSYVEQPSG
jgi:hypothetical protein